eukprot:TRINITY_DN22418_c0_g1_i1.p1 TRINITY_DN22418_c0_g1~~TRINITY_DN22418_c0_g1_i1.p1  ORF type:complete len:486 (-),score=58.46 TRINITY_DN22418_c0_g1_i1:43-1398(-)
MALIPPQRACLRAVLAQAREGPVSLRSMLVSCCDRMDASELAVRALLPESGRRQRILNSAEGLIASDQQPLHGLLLGVKDIIAVEGLPIRCGSMVPVEVDLPVEAEVVRKLRRAGAVVAGKTVTTEFAHRDAGPTANPWNLAHTPGGSSSGSAAGVASGMLHIALGTQTIGSVGRPAAFCGIAGLKPSFGRVSTDGVVIYSHSVDTVGFFAPDVFGLDVVSQVAVEDWRREKHAGSLALPVLGVPEGGYLQAFSAESLCAFEQILNKLACVGVQIRRIPCIMDDFADICKRHVNMTRAEWARSLKTSWRHHSSLFRSKSAMEMEIGLGITDDLIEVGRSGRSILRSQLEKAMDDEQVDLWVTPGALQGSAPLGLDDTGDPRAQLPWTHAGLPTLSLPAGVSTQNALKLPLGLQFAGRFGADEDLLAWGAMIEALNIADIPISANSASCDFA